MRPLAIVPVYNESDILEPVLKHIEEQGCDYYILDNWSNDGLVYKQGERWPAEQPTIYDWTGILKRIEEIALEHKDRWIMLYDADEIRRGPSEDCEDLTLGQCLELATIQGYNAVQFKVKTFAPIDNNWVPGTSPEAYFRYYRSEHVDHGLSHVKAWYQGNQRVDIHTHGGHQVLFGGRKVCPYKFVLKHYPIRSQQHGEQKVLRDRLPRYSADERAKQWHVQYNEYLKQETPNFIMDPKDLCLDRRDVAIITLTGFPDIFEKFAASVERHEPDCKKIVITSNGVKIERPGWIVVEGMDPFIFSRNLNQGIQVAEGCDVLCVNDDVLLTEPLIQELSQVSYLTNAGVVTPQVDGGVGNSKVHIDNRLLDRWVKCSDYLPFICVFLRRDVLNQIGLLDEDFDGYGSDDVEFCLRAESKGFPMVISNKRVKHGFQGQPCSSSFSRVMSPKNQHLSSYKMLLKLQQKSPEAALVVSKILSHSI